MNDDAPKKVDIHPALEKVILANGLDREKLGAGIAPKVDLTDVKARERIIVEDGKRQAIWVVPSIRALFRGDRVPPSMAGEPPPSYLHLFKFVEANTLRLCDDLGDKTDGEFEQAYSELRRRPDGTSRSHLHFALWQTAAVLAGKWPLSAAEFEAIFGRLSRSASTFRRGLVSRFYIGTLRQFGVGG